MDAVHKTASMTNRTLSICMSDWIQTNSVLQQQIYSLLRLFNFAALTIEDKERLELSTIGLTSHRSAIELFIHFVFFNSSFLIPHFLFLIPVGPVIPIAIGRTHNPPVKSRILSPLSYKPVFCDD